MRLNEIVEAVVERFTEPHVMSHRYLREVGPVLERNQRDDDEYKALVKDFDGENPIHIVPESIKNRMSPRMRTRYETVKEAIAGPVMYGYVAGRFLRQKMSSQRKEEFGLFDDPIDERVNDVLFPGHAGHAATELLFFKYGKVSSFVGKLVGYTTGVALSPLGILGGMMVRPKSQAELNGN